MNSEGGESMQIRTRVSRVAAIGLVTLGVILIWEGPALARDRYETIDAQAFGTGTQMGANIGVTLNTNSPLQPTE